MEDNRLSDHSTTAVPPPRSGETQRLQTLDRAPKLLFLAKPFPPLRVTACVRTWNIAKHLSRLGWEVTVVTPRPSLWRDVDNPEKVTAEIEREGIGRILTDHQWRCLSPHNLKCWNEGLGWVTGGVCRRIAQHLGIDKGIGWIKSAERACSDLTSKDVDVILATAPSFSSFMLAKRLSDRLGRPYVLDYRDLWSQNAHDPMPAAAKREAALVAGAAALTTVSRSWASIMDKEFGVGAKIHVVSNGYDLEELSEVKPHNFGHFAIVYTGAFYPPARVISPVMAAIKHLSENINGNHSDWYFHYYGPQESHVQEEAKRFGVAQRVVSHGMVSRREALSAVRGANIAVVITSVSDNASIAEKGIVTGKVFEPLGLGTRIMSVAPVGNDIDEILETSRSSRSFRGNQIDEMASFLRDGICNQLPAPRIGPGYAWTTIALQVDSLLRLSMTTHSSKSEQTSDPKF